MMYRMQSSLVMLAILNVSLIHGLPIKLVSDVPSYFASLGLSEGEPNVHDRGTNLALKSLGSTDLSASLSEDDPDDPDSIDSINKTKLDQNPSSNDTESTLVVGDSSLLDNQTTISTTTTTTDISQTELQLVNINNSTNSEDRLDFISNNLTNHLKSLMGDIFIPGEMTYGLRFRNTYQNCDGTIFDRLNTCDDKNAICELGVCICRPGFVRIGVGLCKSYSDLLENCENDRQCQAIDITLICDTKSLERSFCDCAEGLYFDQNTQTCLPCHRNVVIISKLDSEAATQIGSNISNLVQTNQTQSTNSTTKISPMTLKKLRPCSREGSNRFNFARRLPASANPIPISELFKPPTFPTVTKTSPLPATPSTHHVHSHSSDPFKIRTPLQVVMGAIMLFTMVSVAWFLLQRMIHDCRAIFRSIRQPEYTFANASSPNPTSSCPAFSDPNFARNASLGHLIGASPDGRITSSEQILQQYLGAPQGLTSRDLAGVIMRHITANLSPSSTNQALSAATTGSSNRNQTTGSPGNVDASAHQDDISSATYPLNQQGRNAAAAAAAAQLLMQPSYPAIAILRAVAANSVAAAAAAQLGANANPGAVDPQNVWFDPPPKYEEAVATQSNHNQDAQLNQVPPYSVVVQSCQNTNGTTSTTTIVQPSPQGELRSPTSVSLSLSPPAASFPAGTDASTINFEFDTQSSRSSLTGDLINQSTNNYDDERDRDNRVSCHTEDPVTRESDAIGPNTTQRLFTTPGHHPNIPDTNSSGLDRGVSQRKSFRNRGSNIAKQSSQGHKDDSSSNESSD